MTPERSANVPERQQYIVVPERSAVLIEVSSSIGPLSFGATGLEGFVTAAMRGEDVDLAVDPAAHLELQVRNLTSGNYAYDGELQRHIDARRHPAAYVDLHRVHSSDSDSSFIVAGEITVRGVTQMVEGSVTVDIPGPRLLGVRGTARLDIRRFDVPPPTAFMLKIEPEVAISLQMEARLNH